VTRVTALLEGAGRGASGAVQGWDQRVQADRRAVVAVSMASLLVGLNEGRNVRLPARAVKRPAAAPPQCPAC